MARRLAAAVATCAVVLSLVGCGRSGEPLGTRLQRDAGSGYEVIFVPATGVYMVEPK